jgi:hypothetical protein
MIGLAIAGVGLVLTVGSYAAASGGGSYFIFPGAIIFGLIRAGRGYAMMRSASRAPQTSSAPSMPSAAAAAPPVPGVSTAPAQPAPSEPAVAPHVPPPPTTSMWD